MTLVADNKSQGSSYPPVEAGTHHAICYSIVDIGTQYNPRFDSSARKVVITWELPDVRMDIEKDDRTFNLPRAISKTYTLSLHEKSNLIKDLTSWRGKGFTELELAGFDVRKLIKANCLVQVIHTEKGDKTYANVATVAKLMTGMAKKEPENPTVIYDMGTDGTVFPETMPEWIRKLIMKSEEMQNSHAASNGEMPADEPSDDFDPNVDDGIPF